MYRRPARARDLVHVHVGKNRRYSTRLNGTRTGCEMIPDGGADGTTASRRTRERYVCQ